MDVGKKNVIWIVADQLRADALGVNGDPNVRTPNIDSLALGGVNFTQAVSGAPLCAPFRGCLLTGRYVHECSVPGHDYSLDPALPTVADVFNENGYETLYYGKWHLDGDTPRKGLFEDAKKQIVARGRRARFSTWVGYENNNSQYDCWVHGHDGDKELSLMRLPRYETDALIDMVVEKIRSFGGRRAAGAPQPFFMVLSVQPPHDPYVAPPEYLARYNPADIQLRPNVPPYPDVEQAARQDLAAYYAMIENIDDNVGRVRTALDEAGLSRDTAVMLFSDHGDMHYSHGMLRKTNPYEESVRIPFIIGGGTPMHDGDGEGENSDSLVNHVDIAPTTLGLCGIAKPDWMRGFDYFHDCTPGARASENRPGSAYIQSVIPTCHDNSIDKPFRGVVTRDGYKYVCFSGCEWLMFDLNKDPYELVNLVHDSYHIAKRASLNALLRNWVEQTGDTFDVPVLPYTSYPFAYTTYPQAMPSKQDTEKTHETFPNRQRH